MKEVVSITRAATKLDSAVIVEAPLLVFFKAFGSLGEVDFGVVVNFVCESSSLVKCDLSNFILLNAVTVSFVLGSTHSNRHSQRPKSPLTTFLTLTAQMSSPSKPASLWTNSSPLEHVVLSTPSSCISNTQRCC